jgi:hypothetical protein
VGAGYVVCEALGIVPGVPYVADPLPETLAIIVSDALLIARGTGPVVRPRLWSSSDRGRAR